MHPMTFPARASTAVQPTIIAVIGGINMDLLMEIERPPDVGESMNALSMARLPGGKGANTAIAAHRASRPKPVVGNNTGRRGGATTSAVHTNSQIDIKVCMNGAVGDDDDGTKLKARLRESGVDIEGVSTIPRVMTNDYVVLIDKDTRRSSRDVGYPGANLQWKLPESGSLISLGGGIKPDLIITSLVVRREQVERMLEIAHEQEIDTLLNPSPPEYLVSSAYRKLTHLVMNESETAMLFAPYRELTGLAAYQAAGKYFLDAGVQNVVITLGEKGAYFITQEGESGLVEAEKDIKVEDTTGAGDTFVGTYSVEYIKQKNRGEWDIRKAVVRSCRVSARTLERLGAQESIPWADEV